MSKEIKKIQNSNIYNETKNKSKECPHCKFMDYVFSDIEMTNEIHFIATSIFVYLHNNKTYCDFIDKPS